MISNEHLVPSRRGLLSAVGAGAAVAWLSPSAVFGRSAVAAEPDDGIVGMIRQSAGKEPISATKLRGNITVLSGSGGNIAVFDGPEGKLLVDAGIPASKERITAALAEIGPSPRA